MDERTPVAPCNALQILDEPIEDLFLFFCKFEFFIDLERGFFQFLFYVPFFGGLIGSKWEMINYREMLIWRNTFFFLEVLSSPFLYSPLTLRLFLYVLLFDQWLHRGVYFGSRVSCPKIKEQLAPMLNDAHLTLQCNCL